MFARRHLIVAILATASSLALSQETTETGSEITFQNGIHLRITAIQGTQNRGGVVGSLKLSPPNTVHRLFTDREHHVLFGYDVDALPTNDAGEFQIDLKPLDASFSSLSQPGATVSTLEHAHKVGRLKVGDYFAMHVSIDSGAGGDIRDVIQLVRVDQSEPSDGKHPNSPIKKQAGETTVWGKWIACRLVFLALSLSDYLLTKKTS